MRSGLVVGEYPKKARKSYPTHWVITYGWRQIVLFTPKVWLRSLMVTVRLWPRHGGLFVGLWAGRTEDQDHFGVRAGIGVAEVEFDVMEWRFRSDNG